MQKIFFTLILICVALFSNAQIYTKWHIGIDMGGGGAYGEINEKWPVRQSLNSSYYNDYEYSYNYDKLTAQTTVFYAGIKPEYHFSKQFSIASGIRFTQLYSNFTGVGRNGNYFFLRTTDANSPQTEYYRIKTIEEENYYLTIPLEGKYTFFQWGRVGFFAKLGYDLGYLIHSKSSIGFQQDEMQQYENEVFEKVDVKVNSHYSTVNSAFGINYSTKNGWIYNFDLYGVTHLFTENNSSLININKMSTIQISLMIPIQKNKK